MSRLLLFLLVTTAYQLDAQVTVAGRVLDNATGATLGGVEVLLNPEDRPREYRSRSARDGRFAVDVERAGAYLLLIFAEGYQTQILPLTVPPEGLSDQGIRLDSLAVSLSAFELEARTRERYGLRRLRNVEGTGIYAAKKSEVIRLDELTANLATNNARQIYQSVPGLNVWENDGAGLQLSIGARGLDPNRTSNFNTRQNGYDISADALGYPESYYTPPAQALARIEVVRGAASLQYGPQFGGLLNFVFKRGDPERPWVVQSENTVGSFGLLSSFNSLSGSQKGYEYYGFYQRKQGEGWRPNSQFFQNTAYLGVGKDWTPRLRTRVEFTRMNYRAQQPGGLQDFEFAQDARQSKRARNWFAVDWNLGALVVDYRFSDNTRLNSRTFVLAARREALGELGRIDRPDPLRTRDLIRGEYLNVGTETRLIHRYRLGGLPTTLLLGARYYRGRTQNRQGDASDGTGPDFRFLNGESAPGLSDYTFPSRNVSLFAEQLINLGPDWTVTPGLRYEDIRTAADGYFNRRVESGGQVIFEERIDVVKTNTRGLALLGLGVGHKLRPTLEAYANFSQNYRSINFTDLAVINPNLIVDSLLRDERGSNADLGLRGEVAGGKLRFDASLFYLNYRNRIGLTELLVPDPLVPGLDRLTAYRTNVGDARILGLELYVASDLLRWWAASSEDWGLEVFVNFSRLNGRYTSGAPAIVGNDVELIPPYTLKTGATLRWKSLRAAYQWTRVAEHFSDATNAVRVADATRGLIPTYTVQDLSLAYRYRRFGLRAGVNNLADARYFTRRAAAYPGPGIIPADGRSWYLGLSVSLGAGSGS